MKNLLLFTAIAMFLSCSNEQEEDSCSQITDKEVVQKNGYSEYYFDINNYGLKKVSKEEYVNYNISEEYCVGLKY